MSLPQLTIRYTVEEYLGLERASEDRHEYLDGDIYAMAGESPEHGAICMNLSVSIGAQLRGTPCQAFAKDMKVRSGPVPRPGAPMKGLFSYPDLVVVCGAMQFHDQFRDVLLNPSCIIEVLSDSTEAFDRGEKFRRYRTWLPTLTDYLLVAHKGDFIAGPIICIDMPRSNLHKTVDEILVALIRHLHSSNLAKCQERSKQGEGDYENKEASTCDGLQT